jgi:hypothetical protein
MHMSHRAYLDASLISLEAELVTHVRIALADAETGG